MTDAETCTGQAADGTDCHDAKKDVIELDRSWAKVLQQQLSPSLPSNAIQFPERFGVHQSQPAIFTGGTWWDQRVGVMWYTQENNTALGAAAMAQANHTIVESVVSWDGGLTDPLTQSGGLFGTSHQHAYVGGQVP